MGTEVVLGELHRDSCDPVHPSLLPWEAGPTWESRHTQPAWGSRRETARGFPRTHARNSHLGWYGCENLEVAHGGGHALSSSDANLLPLSPSVRARSTITRIYSKFFKAKQPSREGDEEQGRRAPWTPTSGAREAALSRARPLGNQSFFGGKSILGKSPEFVFAGHRGNYPHVTATVSIRQQPEDVWKD